MSKLPAEQASSPPPPTAYLTVENSQARQQTLRQEIARLNALHRLAEALLRSLGFVGVIPQVLPRINLDEEVEFVDRQGVRSLLWHNPQTRRISVRAVGTGSRSKAHALLVASRTHRARMMTVPLTSKVVKS
jgi:hypothetical protein